MSKSDLANLLQFPNESLTVEHKSWLNLQENHGRATLAKAAIALANHGGGMIVLGMQQNNVEGGELCSQPRPSDLKRYSQDDVNAAINRYADPAFHCELSFAHHPGTGVEHAFVSVPGEMPTPIMSTRDCTGVISAQRCYIRKPGPRSEEPFTGEEWRSILDRCVRAGRESMLDAIRLIVQGHAHTLPAQESQDALIRFASEAKQRWQKLTDGLPDQDVARMPLGRYELSFEILGTPPAASLNELRHRMDAARAIKHTGWGPFVSLSRVEFAPRVIDGSIEAWLGAPEGHRLPRTPAHCDFWRARPDGRLFLMRGYDEDESDRHAHGSCIDVSLPIWRLGEVMLFVSRLARHFGENPTILTHCRYVGLHGRALVSMTGRRYMSGGYRCSDEEAILETQSTAIEIDQNLVEVLHALLVPLYERFSFFDLPLTLVIQETEKMRKNQF